MSTVLRWLRNHWGKILLALSAFVVISMIFTPVRHYKARFRSDTPFDLAHKRAVTSFVDSQGFGIRRMFEDPPEKYWAESTFLIEGRRHYVRSVHLIGITKESGHRFYKRSNPPIKDNLPNSAYRTLTQEEYAAITSLKNGETPFVLLDEEQSPRLSGRSVDVIAPIFARESCLKCHDAEVGDLLGAFNYHTYVDSQNP
ncbi:MAG: hypothetical protein ACJAQT_000733 [Akkermansiaceae bacterium]|jgi:hypothetical protein